MSPAARQFDLVVLGAGAAGLMAASVAGKRGRRVAILDHSAQPGRKILVSGGGRANFTNLDCTAAHYLSANPHFVKSALARFRPEHFLEFAARRGLRWQEKAPGQLFCARSARDLLDLLLDECREARVETFFSTRILSVERSAENFCVETAQGEFRSGALLVSTGGLSYPKLGATGLGYEIARSFGLHLIPTRPALVPFVLSGAEHRWTQLAGLSLPAEIRSGGTRFRDQLLFTHRGLSGPAILQISSYWQPGEEILIDLVPAGESGPARILAPLVAPRARRDLLAYRKALRQALPERMAAFLAEEAAPPAWTNAALARSEEHLHAWSFRPSATEGYAKAEVTLGGIDTRDLDARTLEARSVPGLFFAGEVIDVTGRLGGYNLHWAWASAVAAGNAL